jgi:hypothetical protein
VLRAKYYPNGDILKAGPKNGSSFTWQSILAGWSTFKRGFIWRVGSGQKNQYMARPLDTVKPGSYGLDTEGSNHA